MRKAYKKLTYADRQTIEHMTEQGAEPKKIAEVTGVHVATIYREAIEQCQAKQPTEVTKCRLYAAT